MSRMIADLLEAQEPVFSLTLRSLEHHSGRPSADVRLTADIVRTVHRKAPELLLYPKDMRVKELYAGLLQKLSAHDATIVRALGGKDAADAEDVYKRVIRAVPKLDVPQDCWALKLSVVKKLLKNMPPKKTMKQLGYTSVESMLKRESIPRLYTAMRFIERPEWLKSYYAQYKTLQSSDFEMRTIEVVTTDSQKWGAFAERFVKEARHNIVYFKELGAIVVMPLPVKNLPGLATMLLTLIIHHIDEIRMFSAYGKLQQMKPDFGSRIFDSLFNDSPVAQVDSHAIPWRVVHRHYATSPHFPEVFEPHVSPEDLVWHHAAKVLAQLVPDMVFWHDLDYVGIVADGKPVSFNLMDVAVNNCNRLHFDDRVSQHMQTALWNELLRRYVAEDAFEQAILKQLDESLSRSSIGAI